MNVRLQYDLEFPAGIYYDDRLQLNSYRVNLQITTHTADTKQINLAMERLKCFVMSELADAVFINQADHNRAELMIALGINVTTLPDEPVDQMVGVMLYCKLNAIMEGRMVIERLDIASSLGDEVWYMFDDEDSLGVYTADGWWHKSSCQHDNIELDHMPENVVKVVSTGWHDYGLDWPDVTNTVGANTVVYADFNKHEN